ncbi:MULTISPECIES: DUF5344 family protein [Bhargavaea]|uniref:DUF5344 family protein n=1 Tax=Bhargavaea changchunensis TaxID=2134037 RepID=A0ABW2ND46_9BACL|nr:DUF5344 family protein [Bhargavaea sp. CC-171006]
MSLTNQIKVEFETVRQSVSNMESMTESLDPALPKDLAGSNVLDLIKKINQLNLILEQQGEEFKRILRLNHESVRESADMLDETDHQLSISMDAN